jgi:FAD/FMN-containing dehydrogenase
VGTGPGVGVVGYLVNGGLSGYFSRRLGLLGQRVTKLTVVTAAGAIRVVTPDDELFTAMLGAGSALSVVADVTLELAPEGVVRGAEQRVIAFKTRDQAVAFAREALRMQRDQVLADDSVSMGLVVAGTKVLVATVVFYDSFQGNMADFVSPLEKLAARIGLPVVAASHFGSWFETAAALWPVIDGMKGSPLAMLQHCLGTEAAPAHGRPLRRGPAQDPGGIGKPHAGPRALLIHAARRGGRSFFGSG